MTTADRFDLMLLALAGTPPPPLPALPGRLCRGLHDGTRDELLEQWEALEQRVQPGWLGSRP